MPLKKYLDYDGLAYLLQRFPKTTVHCVFDSEFAGETATLTHGTTTYTKTVPATSPYELTFAVNELGTWTLQSSYLGTQYSDTVDITYLGQKGEVELTIVPDGSTAEPVNSIQVWLKCAKLNKSYTTLEEVLADTETYETLLADSNACQYMKRSTEWTTDITTSQDAMARLGKFSYASNLLSNDPIWAEAIGNSDYMEFIWDVKVPDMTSNTTPEGEASSSTIFSSTYPAYKAFDGSLAFNQCVCFASGSTNNYVQYKFTKPVKIFRTGRVHRFQDGQLVNTAFIFKVSASNDGVNWTDIKTDIDFSDQTVGKWLYTNIVSTESYLYWRMQGTDNRAGDVQEIQFWGRASEEVLVPLVPTMTSNTTPSGVVSASSEYDGSYFPAWKAFEGINSAANDCWASALNGGVPQWIQYEFTRKVIVKKFIMENRNIAASGNSAPKDFELQASNDGSTWTTLGSYNNTNNDAAARTTYTVSNTTAYKFYRLYITTMNGSQTYVSIGELQFYDVSVQTNIIHSTPNDTIYMLEDGDPIVLATTNSDGDGILDFSQLSAGPVTLYSSVAKNPDDLLADYSKTITITKTQYGGTTEAYLMPDTIKTLYWYGVESDNLEDCSTANGWVVGYTNYGFNTPTHNTNHISVQSNSSNNTCAIGNKNSINGTTVKGISKGITAVNNAYCQLGTGPSKTLSQMAYYEDTTTSSIELSSVNLTGQSYLYFGAGSQKNADVYALWYE